MIGIIPAGGKAVRIMGLPKMLLPIENRTLFEILIERMEICAVRQVYIAPSAATVGLLFPYLNDHALIYSTKTRTMTEDMMFAERYLERHEVTLFGMPDTYFEDSEAFSKLASALKEGADVAVGVFKTRPEQRHKLGMVQIAGDEVLRVYDKPAETELTWAWGVLAWKPKFWALLDAKDPHVGYALPRALVAEMDVRAVRMDGGYWDCGTPEEYFDLIHYLHEGVKA